MKLLKEGVKLIGRVVQNIALLIVVLLVTGIAIQVATEKVGDPEKISYCVKSGELKPDEEGFANRLRGVKCYLKFSLGVFKDEEKILVSRTYEGKTYQFYILSPRGVFTTWLKITPEKSIAMTISLLLLSMGIIFPLGLYWGLRAGHRGGISDRILLLLAPVFSGVPGWFWGLMFLWVLWWRFDVGTVSYMNYIQRVEAHGSAGLIDHFIALLIPVLALTFANIVIYAFNVRNLVKQEAHEEYFLVDCLKGLPDRRIRRKLLRTILPSFLTFTSYNFLNLVINGMAIEKLFDVPGLGYALSYFLGRYFVKTDEGTWAPKLLFFPEGIFFVALVMAVLYFLNSTIMETLYLRLDPRREAYEEA
ncbi:MAG TPA: ABC transporter permease [Thermococcus litoralis]|uniref:ABC transporter permease n=1 Tax=Thermococcus litoralis TaxID=2265 RepID=A0A7C5NT19_THELI|nr:ABC transporter permease [Thermococcus litoralis]